MRGPHGQPLNPAHHAGQRGPQKTPLYKGPHPQEPTPLAGPQGNRGGCPGKGVWYPVPSPLPRPLSPAKVAQRRPGSSSDSTTGSLVLGLGESSFSHSSSGGSHRPQTHPPAARMATVPGANQKHHQPATGHGLCQFLATQPVLRRPLNNHSDQFLIINIHFVAKNILPSTK